MNAIWKGVRFYLERVKGTTHPVHDSVTFESSVASLEVTLIPTLWDNYSYIVYSGDQALIIDPSEYGPIRSEIDRRHVRVSHILVTHDHIDHIGAVPRMQRRYGATVLASKRSEIPCPFTEVSDGYELQLNGQVVRALSVPGHYASPYPASSVYNNLAWYAPEARLLFSGDTLFSCGYGFIAEGHERTMYDSLSRLRALPDDCMIFPGHEYTARNLRFAVGIDPNNETLRKRKIEVENLLAANRPSVPTSLSFEKATNPFLRWDDEDLRKTLGIPDKNDYETYLHVRALKNEYNKNK